MPRAKTRVASRTRRKKILKAAKGYFGKRRNSIRIAKDAVLRSGVYAYRDRKQKKRHFRSLWIMRINAGARLNDFTYAELINGMLKKNIELDRKVLADIAMNEPETFGRLVAQVKA